MRAVRLGVALTIGVAACGPPAPSAPSDPLPSWNDSVARSAVVDFVQTVTRTDAPAFVPPAERIAVFDNDGTLWAEQPMYFQLVFALDRAGLVGGDGATHQGSYEY